MDHNRNTQHFPKTGQALIFNFNMAAKPELFMQISLVPFDSQTS